MSFIICSLCYRSLVPIARNAYISLRIYWAIKFRNYLSDCGKRVENYCYHQLSPPISSPARYWKTERNWQPKFLCYYSHWFKWTSYTWNNDNSIADARLEHTKKKSHGDAKCRVKIGVISVRHFDVKLLSFRRIRKTPINSVVPCLCSFHYLKLNY